jgi:hypothetical protein
MRPTSLLRPLAALAFLGPLTGLVQPAAAAGGSGIPTTQPASQLQVAMTLYAGGIGMGKADLNATIRGGEYQVVSNLQTQGVVNAFWQSEIQATASGKLADNNLAPALYDSFNTRQSSGKRQQVSLTYEGSNAPRLYANPVYPKTEFEVKPQDAKGTLDPLSAITLLASGVAAKNGNPCSATLPVFDGRRRYDIELTKIRDVDIKMDNGLYQGKAVQCEARYRPVSGFRQKLLSGSDFPVIRAWVASFPSAVAGRDYTVPVRVWAETKYGVIAVLATSLKIDGQNPKGVRAPA